MLLESIILAACLQKKGCSDSMNAYYKSQPQLQAVIKKSEKEAKRMVGEDASRYVLPIATLGLSRESEFKINNRWSVKIIRPEHILAIKWSF